MKRGLAFRTTCTIGILFVLSSGVLAQSNNCAYTFTFPKNSFSFCVSQYGTLAMLQAPIGVNHLDPVSPIEGWVYYFNIEGNDNFFGGCQVPNLPDPGDCLPQPGSFSQPNGPGTLPLIFSSDNGKSTFTANPATKSVSIRTVVNVERIKGAEMLGLEREGVFQPGGSATFGGTGFGPYAVNTYGVRLTTANGCFGDHSGVPPAWSTSNLVDSCNVATFTGTGTMLAIAVTIDTDNYAALQVTYWVF